MFEKFADRYGAEVILIVILALFVVAFAWIASNYIIPKFKAIKVGSLKMTLGFYVLSFYFFYLLMPFFIKINENILPLFREGLAGISTLIGVIVNHYFRQSDSNVIKQKNIE